MADSTTLLVPVSIKALVVNDAVRKGQNFQRWSMNYGNLNDFTSPEPQPFSGNANDFSSNPDNNGVYLHWTLPDALRHGVETGGARAQQPASAGVIDFPLVPNRWLVVRYSGALTARKADAWIIQSDFLDPNEGTSPFVNPFAETPQATSIGKKINLATQKWAEPGGEMFLTAIGPGDVTFASYQPYVENVFSIHDTLEGVADTDTLSYLLAGWYSDPSKDILAGWSTPDDFAALLSALHWSVSEAGTAKTSVYHGMVYGISWEKSGPIPPSDKPEDSKNVKLAVGNTSVDALTALIRQQAKETGTSVNAELLEAFQYDLIGELAQHDGEEQLQLKIRDAWFGRHQGGSIWEIVDTELTDPAQRENIPPLSPQELQKEELWLVQLNRDQTEYDEQVRLLNDMQWQLYAMWWKNGKAGTLPQMPVGTTQAQFDQALDPASSDSLVSQVRAQIDLVLSLQAKIPFGRTQEELATAIAAYAQAQGLPDQRQLKRYARPDFREVNNPVVLIVGSGETGSILEDDALACRFPGQLTGGFSYTAGDGSSRNITTDSMKGGIPAPDLTNLPQVTAGLLDEFFFLDPNNATMVAATVLQSGDPEVIKSVYNTMLEHKTDIGVPPNTGVLPDLDLDPWRQPWVPLYLEWQVSWYSIDYQTGGTNNWTFDGTNFTWNGNGASQTPRVLSGRIFLTPQAKFNFQARLEAYLQKFPDAPLQDLEDFITTADQWDFLSQALDGFNEQLALRDPMGNLTPDRTKVLYQPDVTIADLIGGNFHYVPIPGPYKAQPFKPMPPSGFQALRGGQFFFEKVSLVDRFGQGLEVVRQNTSDQITLYIAPSMTPAKTVIPDQPYRFVQLTPGVVQNNRLNFDFVSCDDDSKVIDLNADVNPVCAWLLPNHLDNGLAVYDNQGNGLGEARVVINEQQQEVVGWNPAPYSPYTTIADLLKDFKHLGQFLAALQQKGAPAFRNLMKTIDETLWTIDPAGAQYDNSLALYIGRPLVLTRSRLQFALDGPPVTDPSWDKTFNPVPPDFLQDTFSIRLGDTLLDHDGLVGYFSGDDYGQFNTVHVPQGITPTDPPYIKQIGPGNFVPLTFADGAEAFVTMLLDPFGEVNALPGILPAVTLALPKRFFSGALQSMEITFRTGPLLSTLRIASGADTAGDDTSGLSIIMPKPTEKHGTWSWVEQRGQDWAELQILTSGPDANLSNVAPTLRSGLLKLSSALGGDSGKKT